jgi:hypothetical protein
MHKTLLFLPKLFLVALTGLTPLRDYSGLRPSDYNEISISTFNREKEEETNIYEYSIDVQNIGDWYMLVSQTRMTTGDEEIAPRYDDGPFFCREVVKPNDAFNLKYETSGNYEQSQIDMSSIAYGPIDESVGFVEDVSSDYDLPYPKASHIVSNTASSPLFINDFVFKFNGLKSYPERYKIHYYLIIELTYEEIDYCLIADTSPVYENESYLNVEIATNYEIDAAQIEFNNVKAISDYSNDIFDIFGLFAKGLFYSFIGITIFFGAIALVLISAVVLTIVLVVRKKRSKQSNKSVK